MFMRVMVSYKTAQEVSKIKYISELNIGHFIIAESIFVSLKNSIKKFKKIINNKMKIFGIGTDIINIKRMEKSIKKNGDNFKNKVFSKNEILYCEKKEESIPILC